jgi:hypothetical protein
MGYTFSISKNRMFMAKDNSNKQIDGEAYVSPDRTNEGDRLFQKTFDEQTGLDCQPPERGHIDPSRSIEAALTVDHK